MARNAFNNFGLFATHRDTVLQAKLASLCQPNGARHLAFVPQQRSIDKKNAKLHICRSTPMALAPSQVSNKPRLCSVCAAYHPQMLHASVVLACPSAGQRFFCLYYCMSMQRCATIALSRTQQKLESQVDQAAGPKLSHSLPFY